MLLVKTQELDKLQQSKGMYITVYNVDMYMYVHVYSPCKCSYMYVHYSLIFSEERESYYS